MPRSLTPPAGGAAGPVPAPAAPVESDFRPIDPAGRKPDALLWAVAAMIFTYVWRIQDLFPFLGKIRISLVVAAVALGLFVVRHRGERRVERIRSPIVALTIGLLFIMTLGIPTSLWPGQSLSFLMKDFAPTVLLMVMVAASIRSFRDVEWLAWVNLIGAFLYSLYVLLFFEPGASGRLANLVYYDANDFALLVVASIPLAVFFLTRHPRHRRRVFPLLSLALFVMMLMQSGSRGGFLAFIAVMVYLLLRFRAISKKARLATVLTGVGLLVLVANETYWETMRTLLNPKEDYNWSGQQYGGRMEIWKRGIGYMAQRPILGVGARAFPQAEGTLSEIGREFASRGWGFKWSAAHNAFVEIGAEGGVIALILFVSILVVAFRTLLRLQRRGRWHPPPTLRESAMAQALLGSFIGYLVAAMFLSAEYFSFLYVLLGLTMGLAKIAGRESADGVQPVPAYVPAARRPVTPRRVRALAFPRRLAGPPA